MGYTHYWERPKRLASRQFAAAACDCKKVVEHLATKHAITVQYDSDDDLPAAFGNSEIGFNGVGEEGYESFSVEKVFEPTYPEKTPSLTGLWTEFCKTDHKPYDAAVCACLIVLRHHVGEKFIVSSDGDDEEEGWPIARRVCQDMLGYGADFSLLTAGFERFPCRGLVYRRDPGPSLRKCYRLSNDWHMIRVGGKVKVIHPYDQSYTDNPPVVIASNVVTSAWLATVLYIERILLQNARKGKPEFPMGPYLESARGTLHNWTPLAILADALEDRDDCRHMVLRALLPKHF